MAPLLFDDSFDYGATNGSLGPTSGGVWGGLGDTIYDAGTNLTYPGYTSAGGSGKMLNGTNTRATLAVSGPGGVSDVQNVPGIYYALALMSGPIDWWVRVGGIYFIKHGTSNNPNILYGVGAGEQYYDTSVDVGDGPNGIDLILIKITSQAGNDEMRVVANPDLSNLAAVESALSAATPVSDKDMSNGDGVTFTQFSRGPGLPEAQFDEIRFGTSLSEVITGVPGGGGGGGPGIGDFGIFRDWSIEIDSVAAPTGNLNFDSTIDGRDVDLMYANVGLGDPLFDLTGDGTVDQADVDDLVKNVLNTDYGDTDTDGDVDTSDLTRAIINFTSAGGSGKYWAQGDTDADGDVDTGDLTRAIINFTGARMRPQSIVMVAGNMNTDTQWNIAPSRKATVRGLDTTGKQPAAVHQATTGPTIHALDPSHFSRLLTGGASRKPAIAHDLNFQSESDWL